jgi:Ca2+-binding RTX toxin-like protein
MSYRSFFKAGALRLLQSRLLRLSAAAMTVIAAAAPQVAFAGCAEVEAQTPYTCTSYGHLDLGTVTTPLVIPNMNDITDINFSGTHKQTTVYVRNDWTTTFTFAPGTQGNIKFIVNRDVSLEGIAMFLDFSALNTPIKLDLRSSAAQTVAPGLRLTIQQLQKPTTLNTLYYVVIGTPYNDILLGSQLSEVLAGAEGNDIITTFNAGFRVDYEGNTVPSTDVANGGSGNDIIITGSGNDTVIDGDGDDSVKTGQGNDTISISAGTNVVELGRGDDTVNVSMELYGVALGVIDGGQGTDRVAYDMVMSGDCSLLQAQLVSFAQNECAGQ